MTERTELVVESLRGAFAQLMEADPHAFRTKFRKMARDPFAFYRGSACLFYKDMVENPDLAGADERWASGDAARIWIQGDLHVENFGTYLDADGRLVFDVNDFDEAYIAPWTWDVRRFCASLALLCWQKALPDEVIDDLVTTYVRSYLDQLGFYRGQDDDTRWALTLDNARGGVLATLREAKMSTRWHLLEQVTVVEDYRRRFASGGGVRELEDGERGKVLAAFDRYVETIPESRRRATPVLHDVLDVVGKAGLGIGSAGLPAYNVLIEGFNQAIDNDIVLTLKQGNASAVGAAVHDERAAAHFEHHGHRTAASQRALQAHADRFLGWTELDGVGYVVNEFSPYDRDLDWEDLSEPDDMNEVVEQLGRATAKIHCVADQDSEHGLVDVSVEHAVGEVVGDDGDALAAEMSEFARGYARRVREDHHLFVDAFRGRAFDAVAPVD